MKDLKSGHISNLSCLLPDFELVQCSNDGEPFKSFGKNHGAFGSHMTIQSCKTALPWRPVWCRPEKKDALTTKQKNTSPHAGGTLGMLCKLQKYG